MSTGSICVDCKVEVPGATDLCNQTLCWCTDIIDKKTLLDCGKETGHIKAINVFSSAFIREPAHQLQLEDSRQSAFNQTTTYSGDTFEERSIKIEVPPHQRGRSAFDQLTVVMHSVASGEWHDTRLKVNWI